MEHTSLLVVTISLCILTFTVHKVNSICAIKDGIDTSYTVTEYTQTSLHCAVQGNEPTVWTYGQTEVTENCQTKASPYNVQCDTIQRTYNLTFNATWSNRGIYTCSCLDSSQAIILDVEIPIRVVDVTCMLDKVSPVINCTDRTLEDEDVLHITATTSCTFPNPSFSWFTNQTALDISTFNPTIEEIPCTGAQSGQKRLRQSFRAQFSSLGSPTKMEVLVQRARAVSKLEVIDLGVDLIYGFTWARILGLVLGCACAVAGITAGAIGLKKALSKNAVKPKPQTDEPETNGNEINGKNDLTTVSTA